MKFEAITISVTLSVAGIAALSYAIVRLRRRKNGSDDSDETVGTDSE